MCVGGGRIFSVVGYCNHSNIMSHRLCNKKEEAMALGPHGDVLRFVNKSLTSIVGDVQQETTNGIALLNTNSGA